jgi:hypothetical protein
VRDQWYSLLVYAYRASQRSVVRLDARKHFGEFGSVVREAVAAHSVSIPSPAVLRFIPEASGVEFDQKYIELPWNEGFICAPFRFRAVSPDLSAPIVGRVSICVGALEVASIAFAAFNSDSMMSTSSRLGIEERSAAIYANFFPSYSRKDAAIVRACKRALEGIGCTGN